MWPGSTTLIVILTVNGGLLADVLAVTPLLQRDNLANGQLVAVGMVDLILISAVILFWVDGSGAMELQFAPGGRVPDEDVIAIRGRVLHDVPVGRHNGRVHLRSLDCGLSLMCRVESESQCDGASDQNYSEEDERNGSKIPLANHHDVLLDRERFCPGLVPIPVPNLDSRFREPVSRPLCQTD